jgi:AcrR family transcriptional regulator
MPTQEQTASPAKPAGRRERKREATREQIIAAAAALFMERDYDSVTVEEIAGRADVVRGTFYFHFPAKEDVARAVHTAAFQSAADAIGRRLEAGEPAATLMAALLLAGVEQVMANPLLARAVYSHGLRQAYSRPHGAGEPDKAGFVALMKRIVAQGQRTGELRADIAVDEMAIMACLLYANTVWLWTCAPEGEALTDRVGRCLRVFLEGAAV